SRVFIRTISTNAMYHNDCTPGGQATVEEDTGNKPSMNLQVIFAAGKGNISILQTQRGRGHVMHNMRCIGQFLCNKQRNSCIDGSQYSTDKECRYQEPL